MGPDGRTRRRRCTTYKGTCPPASMSDSSDYVPAGRSCSLGAPLPAVGAKEHICRSLLRPVAVFSRSARVHNWAMDARGSALVSALLLAFGMGCGSGVARDTTGLPPAGWGAAYAAALCARIFGCCGATEQMRWGYTDEAQCRQDADSQAQSNLDGVLLPGQIFLRREGCAALRGRDCDDCLRGARGLRKKLVRPFVCQRYPRCRKDRRRLRGSRRRLRELELSARPGHLRPDPWLHRGLRGRRVLRTDDAGVRAARDRGCRLRQHRRVRFPAHLSVVRRLRTAAPRRRQLRSGGRLRQRELRGRGLRRGGVRRRLKRCPNGSRAESPGIAVRSSTPM